MALHHTCRSKLHVNEELKHGVQFEEYQKYVKGPPPRLFFKFCSGMCVWAS